MLSHSVMSNSLRPHGLQHARLLCPWEESLISNGYETGYRLLSCRHLSNKTGTPKHIEMSCKFEFTQELTANLTHQLTTFILQNYQERTTHRVG